MSLVNTSPGFFSLFPPWLSSLFNNLHFSSKNVNLDLVLSLSRPSFFSIRAHLREHAMSGDPNGGQHLQVR